MKTAICDLLGIEVPIFAFSHCRDVVVEVTKAGGFGVLGASTFSPEQLEAELQWIDERTGGRPYGIDVLIPSKYDEKADVPPDELERLIPAEQRDFMDGILSAHGVEQLPPEEKERVHTELLTGRGGMTPGGARRLVNIAISHPLVRMVVSALGAPPHDVVELLRERSIVIGSICGKPSHAARQIEAGVQVIVAQGTEAGGHTGDISTLVLVPEIVAMAQEQDVMVLAAGGITNGGQIAASLAMGAQGVWCGTIWLGTVESELDEFEKSVLFEAKAEDTVRRKARTGKSVRMIKSELSEAWERPEAPGYLPTPLQGILYGEAHARVVRAKRKDLYSFPAGQSVGMVNHETKVANVMYQLQMEYAEAIERLAAINDA
jgi:NAD(P)H-dependent flavin oxidoreductase YrpB (nitropropane dioxygenase family)